MNAPTRTGPSVRRHQSPGTYRTPQEFLSAIEARFGTIAFDLAASKENAVVRTGTAPRRYFTVEDDALKQDWGKLDGTLWCNPPFDPIVPWLEQAGKVRARAGWTLVLAPASVSTEWFAEHVLGKALVLPLRPRITFVGEENPFPKDLALYAFGFGVSGFEPWKWKSTDRKRRAVK